jgi:hypothetical protein
MRTVIVARTAAAVVFSFAQQPGQATTSMPDFSGKWAHPSLNALEQPLSGPGPVRNRSRFSMLDWFGTPYTERLHLVERYRLLDYDATMKAIEERAAKEHFQFTGLDGLDNGSPPDPNYKGKGLQIELTVADEGAFTMPWSATVTFRRAFDERLELVCAENPEWYPGTYSKVPTAEKPDF